MRLDVFTFQKIFLDYLVQFALMVNVILCTLLFLNLSHYKIFLSESSSCVSLQESLLRLESSSQSIRILIFYYKEEKNV